MDVQLSTDEIQAKQQLLQDYEPAQQAFTILEKNQGRLDASFDELWEQKNVRHTFANGKSLWKVMLGELRKELCGDDGFRGKVKEYTNNPGSAPFLYRTSSIDPALERQDSSDEGE